MPEWVLECPNCKFRFEHSQINDVGMSSFYLPLKPELPAGTACACPNCGHSAIYQRTDLLYRA